MSIIKEFRLIGSPLSPFVRKVLFAAKQKNLRVLNDPLIPFYGNSKFSSLSPLRRIPVLLFGSEQPINKKETALIDSTVICEYIDEVYNDKDLPTLYPKSPLDRARARFLEDLGDTVLSEALLWRLWNRLSIERFVFKLEQPSSAELGDILSVCDKALALVASEVPKETKFLFGDEISVADVSLCQPIGNAVILRPFRESGLLAKNGLEDYVNNVLNHPSVKSDFEVAKKLAAVPVPKHREFLLGLGFPTIDTGVTGESPKRFIPRL